MEPFLGQIQPFGFNFAPRGWAMCNGQLLEISQYSALFSLLGTMFGGDGRNTFGLPELRGRAMVHAGNGPGLSSYVQGAKSGTETTTLISANLPNHSHDLFLGTGIGNSGQGNGAYLAGNTVADTIYSGSVSTNKLGATTISSTGGSQAFNNRSPYQVVNVCIALQGIYPSRS